MAEADYWDHLSGSKQVQMFSYRHAHTYRSYKLPTDLVDRIDATAAGYNVGKSDLVAFLLTKAFELLDVGELVIETRPPDGLQSIVNVMVAGDDAPV